MKIQLAISDEKFELVKTVLSEKGIEIDDDAEFILIEKDRYISHLSVRHPISGEKKYLPIQEIISIESYGHTVEVYTEKVKYTTSYRLCQLTALLDPGKYLRVSSSVIVSKLQIKQIMPSLSMKFILTMKDGRKIQVTRSYYQSFREKLGI